MKFSSSEAKASRSIVDAIGPEVDVVPVGQVPAPEGFALSRPAGGQPRDRAGRQASRLRAQQGRQGLPEVAREQTAGAEPRPGAPTGAGTGAGLRS